MWAGIKHAINSKLGTNEFKSLDKMLDEIDIQIRKSNYDSFYYTAYLESIKNTNSNIYVQNPLNVGKTFQGSERQIILSPQNVEIIDRMFAQCSNLTDVIISNYIKKIGPLVFDNCLTLRYIKLPKSLQEINAIAFGNWNNCYVIECEFSKERAIELGYNDSTKNAWGVIPQLGIFFDK